MSISTRAKASAPPANPAWLVQLGHFLFRTRNGLFPVVIVALLFLTTPAIPRGDVRLARLLDLLGILIAVAGQALRVAVIGYRYVHRAGRNRTIYADDLVTSGLFTLSRNPLYVGNLLILGGLFLVWNSPVAYLIGVPFFLLGYRAIVAAEEAYLSRQFGDAYAAYAQRTPRWWPRWAGVAAATAGIPFSWRRVIIKEYSSAALLAAGAAILLMAKAGRYAALEGTTARAWPYWTAVAIIALLWGWARYLKKVKRLRG